MDWVGLAASLVVAMVAGSFTRQKTVYHLGLVAWVGVVAVASGGTAIPVGTLAGLVLAYPFLFLLGNAAGKFFDAVR